MKSQRARLDRFISAHQSINRRDVRLLLAQGRVKVDGRLATDIQQFVDQFTHVTLDDKILQTHTPLYVMLNKPPGVVSATQDKRHKTVIDLLRNGPIDPEHHASLHIAGRLDFNSSGLMLLTNNGRWSRQLNLPDKKVPKRYLVSVDKPLTQAYIQAFAQGMYFPFEQITTRPATLRILSEYEAEVTLVEGRYHQIKRMFGRFQSTVLSLHRLSIGTLALDPDLAPGESRALNPEEAEAI